MTVTELNGDYLNAAMCCHLEDLMLAPGPANTVCFG